MSPNKPPPSLLPSTTSRSCSVATVPASYDHRWGLTTSAACASASAPPALALSRGERPRVSHRREKTLPARGVRTPRTGWHSPIPPAGRAETHLNAVRLHTTKRGAPGASTASGTAEPSCVTVKSPDTGGAPGTGSTGRPSTLCRAVFSGRSVSMQASEALLSGAVARSATPAYALAAASHTPHAVQRGPVLLLATQAVITAAVQRKRTAPPGHQRRQAQHSASGTASSLTALYTNGTVSVLVPLVSGQFTCATAGARSAAASNARGSRARISPRRAGDGPRKTRGA